MAETAVVLSTGLVVYLSLNAVTHPVTLRTPTDASVALAERGHCPGDRAGHLPGGGRQQPLPESR